MAGIVQTPLFLTLLGGGSTQFSHLNQSLKLAPILVCADGGADVALAHGLTPEAVIGDMDSLSAAARAQLGPGIVHAFDDQDSTDFEKCLRSIEAKAILAHGFLGGRLDHQLAALSALARFPAQRCILVGEEDICFLAPFRLALDLPVGSRLSLYPLGPVQGRSAGLQYPIDGIDFAPDGRIGTSNTVTGSVRLSFDGAAMLVLLPRDQVRAALAGLTAAS